LPALSSDTRLTWASSKKYGPFKPRDFITRVHHRQMKDGTFVVMTQSEDVDFHKAGKEHFVRTEVPIHEPKTHKSQTAICDSFHFRSLHE
jgi:hypothetical protein